MPRPRPASLPCVPGAMLLTLLVSVPACSTENVKVEQTLIVGRARDAVALDPALVTDNESIEVTEQIFEHLLTYDEKSTTVGPSLATRWHISDDRRTYTFELRQGVRFHDGTSFNAEAVVFSFMRQK